MKIVMPLEPDPRMRGPEDLRRAKADLPDDTTQQEFWDFVALLGISLFGEEKQEGQQTWNMHGSLKAHSKRTHDGTDNYI